MLQAFKSMLRATVLKCPQLHRQSARCRFEQHRNINMVGAKAHAVPAQRCTRSLIEPLHLVRNFLPLKHTERLDQLKGDAACNSGDIFGKRKHEQRAKQPLNMRLEP